MDDVESLVHILGRMIFPMHREEIFLQKQTHPDKIKDHGFEFLQPLLAQLLFVYLSSC